MRNTRLCRPLRPRHAVPRPAGRGVLCGGRDRGGEPRAEVGCGTGRVLIPTARAGVEVVGLDLSPHMLARVPAATAEESEPCADRVRLAKPICGNSISARGSPWPRSRSGRFST
jgi:SAM-dependent methyltransferase